jgi:hypothetical protein
MKCSRRIAGGYCDQTLVAHIARPAGVYRHGQERSEEKSRSHSRAATQKTRRSSGSCARNMIRGVNFLVAIVCDRLCLLHRTLQGIRQLGTKLRVQKVDVEHQ